MKEASPSSQPSSVAPTLAAMGLFLATAVASQWIQLHHQSKQQQQRRREELQGSPNPQKYKHRNRRRRRPGSRNTSGDEDWYSCNNTSADEGESNHNNSNNNLVLSKEAFRRRRLARRMSFEQVDETTDGETQGHRSQSQSPPREAVTEWSIHRATGDLVSPEGRFSQGQIIYRDLSSKASLGQRKPGRNKNSRRELKAAPQQYQHASHSNAAALNERYHDFHPKYQNWRHFEHFNEHDRAKQKRKSQLLRNQKQLQQRSSRQQDAGEGASQNEDEEHRRKQIPPVAPIISHRRHRQHPKQSTIDNASDEESLSTFDDERENDNDDENDNNDDSLSVASFGSGNQFVWTGGHTSKHHGDESSKSACSFGSNLNRQSQPLIKDIDAPFPQNRTSKRPNAQDSFGPQLPSDSLNRLAIRSGTTGATDTMERINYGGNSSSNNKNNTAHSRSNAADYRMGKFERFYRMLTSSIIDDDSDHIGSDTQRISVSSSSTNFGSSNSFDYDGDVEDRHRALRTEYNAQIMPEKLVLIRHGQSMGNVDETFYATTPDNAMPLTDLGWEQARKAGTILKDKIITPGESVHFIVSPYVRTVETFHGIVSAWCDPESEEFAAIKDRNSKVNAWYERLTELGLTWNEDSRIREQDFGNYQNPEQTRRAKEERQRFGAFYYRFHNGESGSDVFDRVSTFLDSLWRSFETNKSQNYVLVTHGIVLRVLMARYFRYTITQLNTLANPRNCEMVVLGHEGNGRLDLEGRCSLELEEDPETRRMVVKGYKFHKRLRILPKSNIRTVRFRISPKDLGKV